MTSPFLEQFFAAASDYLNDAPARPEALLERFPGWEARPERVGLYGGFVQDHVRGMLEKLYPRTRRALRALLGPEGWEDLVRGYFATRPAVHFEINRTGEAFPEFLAARHREQVTVEGDAPASSPCAVPAYASDLARLEWTRFSVYASEVELPTEVLAPTVNPTLAVLEHEYALCPFWADDALLEPQPGHELAMLWRDPQSGFTRQRAASPRLLLGLKLAAEGIAPEVAAEAGAVSADEVRAAAREVAGQGAILLPPGW